MSKPHTLTAGTSEETLERTVLDELRPLAEGMDPTFTFNSGCLELFQLDLATLAHALTRAGAVADARRVVSRGKGLPARAALRAIALAQAERGEGEAARQTALELPTSGPCSARKTLVEVIHALARSGDCAGAVRMAEELDDSDESAWNLASLAKLQAEVEVGNFASARAVPEPYTNYSWVGMADLFNRAGRQRPAAATAWGQTLRRAIERARAIPNAGARSKTLETVVHNLAWAGDVEGSVLAARANEGTARQEKALVTVVAGLAGLGNFEAAEQGVAAIKGKGARAEALAKIARVREGMIDCEALPDEPWGDVLTYAEGLNNSDERLTWIAKMITFRPLLNEAATAVLAALLRVRQALTGGDKDIRAAGLSRRELLAVDCRHVLKGKNLEPGEQAVAAVRAARLGHIAGMQALAGDLAAAVESAGQIQEEAFRACALALALSGHHEFQQRQRYASMEFRQSAKERK